MVSKTPRTKQKIEDITKPSKTVAAATGPADDSQRLVIAKRSVINREATTENTTPGDVEATPEVPRTAPELTPQKSVTITPPADTPTPAAPNVATQAAEPSIAQPEADLADTASATDATIAADEPDTSPSPATTETTSTAAASPAAPVPPTSPTDPEAAATSDAGMLSPKIEATPSVPNGPTPARASAETRKALEEAEKHEREIQEHIENRDFFVPINSVARKKSIKISFGLTFVVLLLAVVLIDLMLDSGFILLIQKIPHTHFFEVVYNASH